MVQRGAVGSPLPQLLWTIQLGAWENASELLSYLEQPGRCSLPSTIWHLPGSLLCSRLVQSYSTSLRLTAPKTFPYLTGTYFSSHSIFISYHFPSQLRHFTFLRGCCGLGQTLLLESNNEVNHCNTHIQNIRG